MLSCIWLSGTTAKCKISIRNCPWRCEREPPELLVERELLIAKRLDLPLTLSLAILHRAPGMQGEASGQPRAATCSHDSPAPFISARPWWRLDLPGAPGTSTLPGHDTGVIYLFDYCPASWHVPLIDGHCVPAARRAVTLAGTKQLEGQLCGDPSYSPSLFPLAFTSSLPPPPPPPPPINSSRRSISPQFFPSLTLFCPFFMLSVCPCKCGRWPS